MRTRASRCVGVIAWGGVWVCGLGSGGWGAFGARVGVGCVGGFGSVGRFHDYTYMVCNMIRASYHRHFHHRCRSIPRHMHDTCYHVLITLVTIDARRCTGRTRITWWTSTTSTCSLRRYGRAGCVCVWARVYPSILPSFPFSPLTRQTKRRPTKPTHQS